MVGVSWRDATAYADFRRTLDRPDDVPRQDVTEDMARAVRDRIRDQHRPLSYAMASWLQNVLGTDCVPWPAASLSMTMEPEECSPAALPPRSATVKVIAASIAN